MLELSQLTPALAPRRSRRRRSPPTCRRCMSPAFSERGAVTILCANVKNEPRNSPSACRRPARAGPRCSSETASSRSKAASSPTPSGPGHARVSRGLQYVTLHLMDTNATAQNLRKGALIGQDASIVPASHELTRVIPAIAPGAPDEAYNLLRTYFETLLLDPSNLPKSSHRKQRTSINEILRDAVTLAAKVEAIVKMQQGDTAALSKLSAEEFDRKMNEEADFVVKASRFDQIQNHLFHADAKTEHWFFLAVTAAFRNAFRHSTKSMESAPLFEFEIIESHGPALLIRNSFNTLRSTEYEGRSTGGTLKAIRGYVRGFGKDPRLVKLKRVSVTQSDDPKLTSRIGWETTFPLPGNT